MADLTHEIVSDPMLTPDAVRLVLYVRGLGPGRHEIDADTLRALLRCKSDTPVYKARSCAKAYLAVHAGGKGHAQRYEYIGPAEDGDYRSAPGATYKDTSSQGATYNGYVAPTEEVNGASSPTTTTPPPSSAGAKVEDLHLEKLRRLLGTHGDVLDRFAASASHNANWPRDLWSAYRPPSGEAHDGGGTEWAAEFAGEDEETAVRAMVNALRDYAENGERFSGFLFRKYVRTALREIRSAAKAVLEGTGTDGGAPRRNRPREKPPQDQQEYKPKPFRGFNG